MVILTLHQLFLHRCFATCEKRSQIHQDPTIIIIKIQIFSSGYVYHSYLVVNGLNPRVHCIYSVVHITCINEIIQMTVVLKRTVVGN